MEDRESTGLDHEQEIKRKRLRRYLWPLRGMKAHPKVVELVDAKGVGVDWSRSVFMFGQTWQADEINYCWAHQLLRQHPLPEYERFSINDLGNMEFGKHPVYPTCRAIHTPLVLLFAGPLDYMFQSNGKEFSNEVWFKEFWDARVASGARVWVYAEERKYRAIEALSKLGYQTIRLGVRPVESVESGDAYLQARRTQAQQGRR